jgi:hypothetical protein
MADPLLHLSRYEAELLQAMIPTPAEVQRLASVPALRREAVITAILLERRTVYEQQLARVSAAAGIEMPVVRNQLSEERLAAYRTIINTAIGAASEFRISNPEWNQRVRTHIRDAVNLPDTGRNRRRKRNLI